MARLEPFRGTYYEAHRVVADDVIAPPYDVVDASERERLAARSPYNAIHVELPSPPTGSDLDPYENAASIFRRWHEEGIVSIEDSPSFAVYTMTFTDDDGSERSTTGVLGALGLDPGRHGDVLPHEETIARDRYDRLSLLRAARTNFSPIWVLSLADGFTAACKHAAEGSSRRWRAVDDEGVLHEIAVVSLPDALQHITEVAAAAPVLVADGHHRYETACAYLADGAPAGADSVLALVVELSEDELSVGPIHRLVGGVDGEAVGQGLQKWFEVRETPLSATALTEAMAANSGLGLVTAAGGFLLLPRPELVELSEDGIDSVLVAVALDDL
ncbi:MAG: DUF1015 domain-containing protein, partial [Acidimicrobiales bacterium]